jgi:hypothetical protein
VTVSTNAGPSSESVQNPTLDTKGRNSLETIKDSNFRFQALKVMFYS